MSRLESQSQQEMPPLDTDAMLRRILAAVEKDRRNHWVDISCAIVLSLTTMLSAWCAYQSTRWGGVQTFRLAAVNKASRASSAASLTALQLQAIDSSMGINWMQARHEGNERQEKFLFDRFRPEMRAAVQAWLKTEPFTNPEAPLGPMKMAEYAQPELAEAKRQDELSAKEYDAAMQANQTSDTYVLLTVLFASVLFFGGIAGTLDSRRLRVSILSIALALFIVTLAFLGTMPVCRE
jgi:hypothetical protein